MCLELSTSECSTTKNVIADEYIRGSIDTLSEGPTFLKFLHCPVVICKEIVAHLKIFQVFLIELGLPLQLTCIDDRVIEDDYRVGQLFVHLFNQVAQPILELTRIINLIFDVDEVPIKALLPR
jgi:hypothetical protein